MLHRTRLLTHAIRRHIRLRAQTDRKAQHQAPQRHQCFHTATAQQKLRRSARSLRGEEPHSRPVHICISTPQNEILKSSAALKRIALSTNKQLALGHTRLHPAFPEHSQGKRRRNHYHPWVQANRIHLSFLTVKNLSSIITVPKIRYMPKTGL